MRPASTASVPIISGISDSIAVAPISTRRSLTSPTTGFAVMPLNGSDPPHSSATVRPATPHGWRR